MDEYNFYQRYSPVLINPGFFNKFLFISALLLFTAQLVRSGPTEDTVHQYREKILSLKKQEWLLQGIEVNIAEYFHDRLMNGKHPACLMIQCTKKTEMEALNKTRQSLDLFNRKPLTWEDQALLTEIEINSSGNNRQPFPLQVPLQSGLSCQQVDEYLQASILFGGIERKLITITTASDDTELYGSQYIGIIIPGFCLAHSPTADTPQQIEPTIDSNVHLVTLSPPNPPEELSLGRLSSLQASAQLRISINSSQHGGVNESHSEVLEDIEPTGSPHSQMSYTSFSSFTSSGDIDFEDEGVYDMGKHLDDSDGDIDTLSDETDNLTLNQDNEPNLSGTLSNNQIEASEVEGADHRKWETQSNDSGMMDTSTLASTEIFEKLSQHHGFQWNKSNPKICATHSLSTHPDVKIYFISVDYYKEVQISLPEA